MDELTLDEKTMLWSLLSGKLERMIKESEKYMNWSEESTQYKNEWSLKAKQCKRKAEICRQIISKLIETD